MNSVFTVNQDSATLNTPNPANQSWVPPRTDPARRMTPPTEARLATAADNTMRSVAVPPGSSVVARVAVRAELIATMARQTQPVKISAATSQPTSGA